MKEDKRDTYHPYRQRGTEAATWGRLRPRKGLETAAAGWMRAGGCASWAAARTREAEATWASAGSAYGCCRSYGCGERRCYCRIRCRCRCCCNRSRCCSSAAGRLRRSPWGSGGPGRRVEAGSSRGGCWGRAGVVCSRIERMDEARQVSRVRRKRQG